MSHGTADFWYHLYTPKAGDTIVDVGAGQGEDLAAFSRSVGDQGRVIAIEPHPQAVEALLEVRRQGNLNNTTILPYAVMDHTGPCYVEDGEHYLLNRAHINPARLSNPKPAWSESLDVISRNLKIDVIDLLKVNIEGGEVGVLVGGMSSVKRSRYVCIACHDFRAAEGREFETRATVTQILEAAGFEVTLRLDDPRDYVRDHVHARNLHC